MLALLADDAVTIEYWKLSAPPYMLAGIVALLLMAAIVASGYPKPRRWLFATPRHFRRTHGIASIAADRAGGLAHRRQRALSRYAFKQALFVVMLVGVPLWLIRRPDLQRPLVEARRREPGEARRETLYIGAVALTIAVNFSALRNLL